MRRQSGSSEHGGSPGMARTLDTLASAFHQSLLNKSLTEPPQLKPRHAESRFGTSATAATTAHNSGIVTTEPSRRRSKPGPVLLLRGEGWGEEERPSGRRRSSTSRWGCRRALSSSRQNRCSRLLRRVSESFSRGLVRRFSSGFDDNLTVVSSGGKLTQRWNERACAVAAD